MAIKTETIETSDYEKEVFSKAHSWTVKVGRHRFDFKNESRARDTAVEVANSINRGATLYAVAEVLGVDTGALLATYKPANGWKESDH